MTVQAERRSAGGLADFGLAGKVVVVTGAGRGIGRAVALDVVASGGTAVACSRTAAELDSLRAEVDDVGGRITTIVADVSTVDGIQSVIDHAVATFGRVDGMVNNAGWNQRRPAVDYTEDEVDQILGINLKSVYWGSVLAARQMLAQGTGGSIVNVSSHAGVLGSPGRAPYSAAKAGILNLSRTLAGEWGREGIRVNALAPGVTMTGPAERAVAERPDFVAEMGERILLGRAAAIREVSAPIVFLLSAAAGMITGQTLVVDGGWTAV